LPFLLPAAVSGPAHTLTGMAMPTTSWKDLDQRKRGVTPVRVIVAAALAASFGSVVSELVFHGLRGWFAEHPVTVAVVSGLIFLVLTVFLVERWLAFNESQRWRTSAMAALDAYIHSADDAVRRIYSRVYVVVEELPAPPNAVAGTPRLPSPEPHIGDAVARLLAQDERDRKDRLVVLSSFIRVTANELSVTALLAMQTIARHEPFAWVIGNIAKQQSRLADAARTCNALDFMRSGFGGAHDATYRKRAAKGGPDIEDLLQAFVDELHTMRTQLDEVPAGE
jgi:hypothetical protein